MFSTSQVVMLRKTLEKTYSGLCEIIYQESYKKENGSTGFKDVTAFSNVPCRLSFENLHNTTDKNNVNESSILVKIFINPDIVVKTGAKIIVSQNGRIFTYKSSSEPAVHETHQEIKLQLFEKFS